VRIQKSGQQDKTPVKRAPAGLAGRGIMRSGELIFACIGIVVLCVTLVPLAGRASSNTKRFECMTNLQHIGLALQEYARDYDGTLSVAYHYNNTDPKQKDGLDDTGIHNWSAFLRPYLTDGNYWVCPSDPNGGQPPTNFQVSTNNDGAGIPEGATSGTDSQDDQAPRLSYTCNEVLMPRPRGGVGGLIIGQKQNLVTLSMVNDPGDTIAVTEFTDHLNAVSGGGPGGIKFKSHRPTDALALDAGGTVAYDTSKPIKGKIYAISPEAADALFESQPTVAFGNTTAPHLIYIDSGRHRGRDSFLFLDGHVASLPVDQTLDCDHFLWGTRAYNQASAEIMCSTTGQPVQ